MRKRSVGLVVLVQLPGSDEPSAVLQVRGEFNHEKMGPESYPGACQITAHGKCEEDETVERALIRETYEELGPHFANMAEYFPLIELNRVDTPEKLVINYGMWVRNDDLTELRLTASTGGIRLIKKSQVDSIVDLKNFDKTTGITDRRVTAMFSDEKEALRLAFEKAPAMKNDF